MLVFFLCGLMKYHWHWTLVLGSQHERSNALSITSPVVDEERMRSDQWLGLVLCVPFSVLTLMVGCQEGHLPVKYPISLIHRSSLPGP